MKIIRQFNPHTSYGWELFIDNEWVIYLETDIWGTPEKFQILERLAHRHSTGDIIINRFTRVCANCRQPVRKEIVDLHNFILLL